jgi:hypothetical protein
MTTMSKSSSPSDRAPAQEGQSASPSEPSATPHLFYYIGALLALFLIGLAVIGIVSYFQSATPKESSSEELDLLRRFMALKNDHNSAANDLLGPAPVVPKEAVSPEEADRLHAEFFLRGEYRVEGVRPETKEVSGPDARFVLVLRGGVTSPTIPQKGPDGIDVINRSMSNPEIVVRVVDGKIRAVLARIHHDADEKPMSEEDQRRVREDLEEQQRRLLEFYQGKRR